MGSAVQHLARSAPAAQAWAGGLMQDLLWKPTERSGAVLGAQRPMVDAMGLALRTGGLQPNVRQRELSLCARICRISTMQSTLLGASGAGLRCWSSLQDPPDLVRSSAIGSILLLWRCSAQNTPIKRLQVSLSECAAEWKLLRSMWPM